MELLIFGSTVSIGRQLVMQAIEQGHLYKNTFGGI
jgi:hypothetical protein